ncbi:hypothetical protein D3C75_817850 [compost metagenome]
MLDIAGDKESIGCLDHADSRGIECRRIDTPLGGFRDAGVVTQLDVLRAVAERLLHSHLQLPVAGLADLPVEAVAPAGVQFDTQQADRLPGSQPRGGGIVCWQLSVDRQLARVRRADETFRPFQQRCPGPPQCVHAGGDHERQLVIENTMLVGHVVTNDLLPERLHALRDTGFFLQGLLPRMPG